MANSRGNPQNLINLKNLPKEKAQKIRSEGGKARQAQSKARAQMREVARAFLDADLPQSEKKRLHDEYGISDDIMTYRALLIKELIDIICGAERASDKITAIKTLTDLAGETPEQLSRDKAAEKLEQAVTHDDPFTAAIKTLFVDKSA